MLMSKGAAAGPGHFREASRTERARRLKPALERGYIVPVLLKSCAILELLRGERSGMRIEQIHQQTGIAKTTVYRIVRTLAVSGYVRQSESGCYSVTGAMEPRRIDLNHTAMGAEVQAWCGVVDLEA